VGHWFDPNATVQRRVSRPQRVVVSLITLLFVFAMTQIGLQWYYTNWTFVENGATRETMARASQTYPSASIHLVTNITYFGPFILADWLMVGFND